MKEDFELQARDDALAFDYNRHFRAPLATVFAAHADPELVKKWQGPAALEMEITRWDFHDGGGYRFVHRAPDGSEFWFNGVFHKIRDNELIVQTFEFEGSPDMVQLELLMFEQFEKYTKLIGRTICPTVGVRDALVDSGIEGGMAEGYDRLAALIEPQ